MLRLTTICLVLSFLSLRWTPAPVAQEAAPSAEKIRLAVQKTLNDQEAAWNRGDISGFMEGYVKTDQLRFASGGSTTHGWQSTLEGYQKRYTDRSVMGQLSFRDVQIMPLSDHYAEVFGSWHLSRDKEAGDVSGLFTLLMTRTASGWRVLHDHTSSAKQAGQPQ